MTRQNRMGDNPSTDFGPNGTFPGDTPRASLPRGITRSCLDCVTNQKTSAKEAILAVVAPCERNCSSAQLS